MFDHTDITEPRYAICIGLDGKQYAVFRDEFAREEYDRANPSEFRGCLIASFGKYENAFLIDHQATAP